MGQREIKWGVVISYLLIIFNTVFGFVVTPFILKMLGESSYGVYKTIASFTSSMLVLDLGLGGTIMRYIANYRAKNENHKIQPFISMAIVEGGVIILILAIASVCVYFNIERIYKSSFSTEEISLAYDLFKILAVTLVLHIIENIFNGIITGYNNFIFGNGIKLVRILLRIVLIYVILAKYKSAVMLVSIDLMLTVIAVLIEAVYIQKIYNLKFKISLKNWDWFVFKESFIYTLFLFLTSIAAQINSNLDNVVIGIIKGAKYVTIYSFGIIIFGMYQQLSTTISGVMLPTVAREINYDSTGEKIQDLIVKAGRLQFILLGGALVGFVILGKRFINLWLGNGFEDVYIIVLILIIPSLFELCVNVCLTVLRAKNMLGFRTAILCLTTLLNLIISVIGVMIWGYFAAAIGTAVSFVLGSLIIMNIYYYKKLGFNMLRIYKRIMSKTWVCLILAGVVLYISSRYINWGWIGFVINVLIFCVVYGLGLLLSGAVKIKNNN